MVRDRVVQAGLRHVLEPIFERDFAERSYGFRPGRGCLRALRRVEELLMEGQVSRLRSGEMSEIIAELNPKLEGLLSARVRWSDP